MEGKTMIELWSVTYQMHDKNEGFHSHTEVIQAESIGEALKILDKELYEKMEAEKWSDYHITGINIIPELH